MSCSLKHCPKVRPSIQVTKLHQIIQPTGLPHCTVNVKAQWLRRKIGGAKGIKVQCTFQYLILLMPSWYHAASTAKSLLMANLSHAPSHANVYSWQTCVMHLPMPKFTHGKLAPCSFPCRSLLMASIVPCTFPCQSLLMASLRHAASHAKFYSWQGGIMHPPMPNFTHCKLAPCTFPRLSLLMARLHHAPFHA